MTRKERKTVIKKNKRMTKLMILFFIIFLITIIIGASFSHINETVCKISFTIFMVNIIFGLYVSIAAIKYGSIYNNELNRLKQKRADILFNIVINEIEKEDFDENLVITILINILSKLNYKYYYISMGYMYGKKFNYKSDLIESLKKI